MMDNITPNFLWDFLRSILSLLDRVAYQLLAWIYEIFFNVARNEVFSDETIMNFFDRVFIIIGIFMLFKLAFSLLNSIVNPDMLTDKEKGFGKITVRIVTVLALITVLMPTAPADFNPNNASEEEKRTYSYKIKTHGLLFGTLYTLQDRILEGNAIGKLILGSSTTGGTDQSNEVQSSGNNMASTVLKAFVYPNMDEDSQNSCKETPAFYNQVWKKSTVTPGEILNLINEECDSVGGEKRYAYSYMPLISTAVGIVLLFIIFSFTIDVAIRSIKLSVLRLIAPIPIISYIDPKSAKDGAFAAWTKTLSSTYLDLFLRLIVIYFAIYVVNELTRHPPTIEGDNFIIKSLVLVFLIVGAFFFAKQAPKFFKDMLGIKGQGSGSVGLSGLLGGTAALIGGAGLAGAGAVALGNMNAAAEAAGQGKSFNGAWSQGSDAAARLKTGDKNARGGFVNRLQQRATLSANRRAARKLGLTQDTLDRAKANMFDAQAEAAKAQDTYDRFNKGAMSDAEMSGLASQFGHFDTSSGQMVMNDTEKQQARAYLYNDVANKQSAAGKAESNYKKADREWSARGLDSGFVEDNSPQRFYRARKVATSAYDKVNGQGAWDARSQQKASDKAARQSAQTDKVVERSRERGGFDPNKR